MDFVCVSLTGSNGVFASYSSSSSIILVSGQAISTEFLLVRIFLISSLLSKSSYSVCYSSSLLLAESMTISGSWLLMLFITDIC